MQKILPLELLGMKRSAQFLWILICGSIAALVFQDWEFTTDDARTLLLSERFWYGSLGVGAISSWKIPHGPLVYGLYAVFQAFYKGPVSVQVGITIFRLFGHWCLLDIGDEIKKPFLGYFASTLLFFSPIFFNFYDQKFWEPALLPAFSCFALWGLIRYTRNGSLLCYLVSWTAAAFAVSCHHTFALLFPVLLLEPILRFKNKKHFYLSYALAAPLFSLSIAPFFQITAAEFQSRVRFDYTRSSVLLRHLEDFFVFGSSYVESHVGNHAFGWSILKFPLDGLLLVGGLIFFFFRKHFSREERILFSWFLCPFVALVFYICIFQNSANPETLLPHHWLVVLFPGFWLVIGWLFQSVYKYEHPRFQWVGKGAALFLGFSFFLLTLVKAFEQASYVRATGGVALHLASLKTKQKAMDAALVGGEQGQLLLAARAGSLGWYDLEAWSYLSRFRKKNGLSATFTYFYQESGPYSDPGILSDLQKMPGAKEQKIDSIRLVQTSQESFVFGIPID